MLVRMTVSIAGPSFHLDAGCEHDFPVDEASRLIDRGYAVPVSVKPIERAVIHPVKETRRKKGRG